MDSNSPQPNQPYDPNSPQPNQPYDPNSPRSNQPYDPNDPRLAPYAKPGQQQQTYQAHEAAFHEAAARQGLASADGSTVFGNYDPNKYRQRRIGFSGILAFILAVIFTITSVGILISSIISESVSTIFLAAILLITAVILFTGIYIQRPNEERVITFFGKYIGTDNNEGLRFTAPWNGRDRVSLRLHNFATQTSKVNDANGNPIMISAVVVWQVVEAPRAIFEVEDYVGYVNIQSESAVRQVARAFPYDAFDEANVITLIGDTGEVNEQLRNELQARMTEAGVHIVEARITDLSYAPEIAEAMLRRQQAAAIVAARQKIVEGAVGMVKDAVLQLEEGDGTHSISLDAAERARFASNLMTVITSDTPTNPVVNIGM